MISDRLIANIRIFLNSYNIDAIYASNAILLLTWIFRYRDFSNWNKLDKRYKTSLVSTLFGTIVITLINLLRLLSIVTLF